MSGGGFGVGAIGNAGGNFLGSCERWRERGGSVLVVGRGMGRVCGLVR